MKKRINRVYNKLYRSFGRQNWWPAKTRFEVIVGAMLTQNTSWSNVEKAIHNLRRDKLLTLRSLSKAQIKDIASAIKPSGYFNIKAKRLKNLLNYIKEEYNGSLAKMASKDTLSLREKLLSVNGVGPETADSILLYAFNKPVFVVDAYTKRIFSRLNIVPANATYEEIQKIFLNNLDKSAPLYNEYHALIVKLGKDYCHKSKPNCNQCPVKNEHRS